MTEPPAVMSTEERLCAARFELLNEARKIVGEILDHWAAIAGLWRQFKELKARDNTLVREIKTHRVGIVHDADNFIPQMGMDSETRKTCEQISRRASKLRERFKRLAPVRAVGRQSTYVHPAFRKDR